MSRVVIVETLRRHMSNVIVVAFVMLLMMLGLVSSRLEGMIWPPFVTLLAIVTGGALIGPEFSTGTLQLILVKPINRSVYLVSRFAGVVLFIAIAVTLTFGAEAIGRLIWRDGEGIKTAAIALVNVTSESALICALLAFFGSFLRAYFNIALYWLINVILSIVRSLFNASRMARDGFLGWVHEMTYRFPIIEQTLDFIEKNLLPDVPPKLDRDWLLLVWSNAAIAIVLACLIFRKREVPYGAD